MTDDPTDGGAARAASPEDGFTALRAVADAVLYEGYLLYPYRRSSPKNRVRWQFGVLTARAWAEAAGPGAGPAGVSGAADSWYQQTECLVRADPAARVRIRLRHLQLQRKQVERSDGRGGHLPVESLDSGGTVHLTFDEAVPRETGVAVTLGDLFAGERAYEAGWPGGEDTEPLPGGAGRVVRRRWPVGARLRVRAEEQPGSPGLYRLWIRTENTGSEPGFDAPRETALRHALLATHTLVGGEGLEFLSLTDPPPRAAAAARQCRNVHTFPVLGGAPGSSGLVLSSPIILSDHPQVAPESPGDLHDAAEIDEILTLRTMLLTDDEKREARATDARAARILDRVESMPQEVFERLHGAIRSLEPAPAARAAAPWWQEGGDEGLSPATDTALVDGVPVAAGSRVRLRPSGRGADAHDMFLTGRTARVAAVFHDVDGSVHLAVTVDDDPAAELNAWYGRHYYFRPHELEPLDPSGPDGRGPGSRPAQAGPAPGEPLGPDGRGPLDALRPDDPAPGGREGPRGPEPLDEEERRGDGRTRTVGA
ncbi:hypothetical protein BJP40_16790 [Streptomyces sp. CC53]|uniref:hypothetical protein n=1 Tax=unclassified Streptomyces TaxID=2593676 RepID=UPI0008DD91C8|nr:MULTISPECIES: hypothetical protein [unclassified Streptomyces]OII65458.1 hypothetical protein BJP40_16790 [Streptomyces sp. CC53]